MVNADAGRHPLGVQSAEQPVGGRRAEHEVDPAAALAQRLGQQEQRGRAVAAADEHAVGRVLRQRERPPSGPTTSTRVVRAQPGEPRRSLSVDGEDELHRAAVDPARGTWWIENARRSSIEAVVATDRQRDELARPGLLRDAGGHDRHREVGADLLDREHLPLHLHRASCRAPAGRHGPSWCSCRGATPTSPLLSASMPCTAAASACTVVRHGTPLATAAVRIS